MEILRFDEAGLLHELDQLSRQCLVAFAAACAERQLPCYLKYAELTHRGDPKVLAEALSCVWDDLLIGKTNEAALREHLEYCMSLTPEDNENCPGQQAHADDAVASVAFAIRARLAGDSQEAVWAARRAYDSVDHYVTSRRNSGLIERDVEARILLHPLVQAELSRQREDLSELRGTATGDLDVRSMLIRLRDRARQNAAMFLDND